MRIDNHIPEAASIISIDFYRPTNYNYTQVAVLKVSLALVR